MSSKSKYKDTPPQTDRMPPGVPYIVGNEAAERFSFYGMAGILMVFMTEHLLNSSGDGLDVMTNEEAQSRIHDFKMAAYAFPVLGALISDIFLGKYRTIILLSLVYCAGHAWLSAFETRMGLLVGLGLIALGAGGIKPCVSAHVGDQFGKLNQHLLPRVFQWFYFSINLGAAFSMLLTPWLLREFGPSVAFGVPAVFMLAATIVIWMGRNTFVHIPPSGWQSVKEAISGPGLRAIGNLSVIFLFVMLFFSVFDQTSTSWVAQAKRMNLSLGPVTLYPSQILAANPFLILIFIPLFSYVVYPAIDRFFPLTPLRKMAIGYFVAVAAVAVPALIETQINGGHPVPFRMKPEDKENKFATSADDQWNISQAIDGSPTLGWAAKFDAPDEDSKEPPPPHIAETAFRLRDRQAWKIESLGVNNNADCRDLLADIKRQQAAETTWQKLKLSMQSIVGSEPSVDVSDDEVQRARAQRIELLVSDSRFGPWDQVADVRLSDSEGLQTFSITPVEAEYVMFRVHGNNDSPVAAVTELAVNAGGELPKDAAANASEVWPNVVAAGYRPSIGWQLLAYVLITAAEIMISITCLEFAYTQAPNSMKSFIMSIFLVSIALGNLLTSTVNRWIQLPDGTSKLEGASYHWFFTGLLVAAAVSFVVVAKFYRGETYVQGDEAVKK